MTDDVDYAEGLGQVLWGQWSECLDWGSVTFSGMFEGL